MLCVMQVQSFVVHFWQGMPAHIRPILSSDVIVSLIGVCDSILYKAILDVLMPSILQPLPDRYSTSLSLSLSLSSLRPPPFTRATLCYRGTSCVCVSVPEVGVLSTRPDGSTWFLAGASFDLSCTEWVTTHSHTTKNEGTSR